MQALQVTYKDTEGFSKVWNHKGIVIPMQEPHIQFATDYANVVLNNYIQMCIQYAAAAKKKAEEEAAPKISLE